MSEANKVDGRGETIHFAHYVRSVAATRRNKKLSRFAGLLLIDSFPARRDSE
jgi:hypothetical protein